MSRSIDLALNPVFKTLVWTDTNGHVLLPKDLAAAVGEDPPSDIYTACERTAPCREELQAWFLVMDGQR